MIMHNISQQNRLVLLTVRKYKCNFSSHTIKMFGYMDVALKFRGRSTGEHVISLCIEIAINQLTSNKS